LGKYYKKVNEYFPNYWQQKYNFHNGIDDWGSIESDQDRFDIAAAVQMVYQQRLNDFMHMAYSITAIRNWFLSVFVQLRIAPGMLGVSILTWGGSVADSSGGPLKLVAGARKLSLQDHCDSSRCGPGPSAAQKAPSCGPDAVPLPRAGEADRARRGPGEDKWPWYAWAVG
jgi:hypothetical protein